MKLKTIDAVPDVRLVTYSSIDVKDSRRSRREASFTAALVTAHSLPTPPPVDRSAPSLQASIAMALARTENLAAEDANSSTQRLIARALDRAATEWLRAHGVSRAEGVLLPRARCAKKGPVSK